jgi:hypothetical protein
VELGLGFGLLAILIVLAFIAVDRWRSQDLESRLIREGHAVAEHDEPAQAGPMRALMAAAAAGPITGPHRLVVGHKADYTYAPLAGGATVAWSVSGPATIPQGVTAATVSVTATGAGTIELTARVDADAHPYPITAVAAPVAPSSLSTLGEGYGTVVIALAVASVTVTLGLTDVLSGEAVAGLLGSLVTYSVVRGTNAAAQSGQRGSGRRAPPEP